MRVGSVAFYAAFAAVAAAVIAAIVVPIVVFKPRVGGPSTGELERRANSACGADRTVDVEYNPRGFGHRQSFETTCRRADGSVYTVVTK